MSRDRLSAILDRNKKHELKHQEAKAIKSSFASSSSSNSNNSSKQPSFDMSSYMAAQHQQQQLSRPSTSSGGASSNNSNKHHTSSSGLNHRFTKVSLDEQKPSNSSLHRSSSQRHYHNEETDSHSSSSDASRSNSDHDEQDEDEEQVHSSEEEMLEMNEEDDEWNTTSNKSSASSSASQSHSKMTAVVPPVQHQPSSGSGQTPNLQPMPLLEQPVLPRKRGRISNKDKALFQQQQKMYEQQQLMLKQQQQQQQPPPQPQPQPQQKQQYHNDVVEERQSDCNGLPHAVLLRLCKNNNKYKVSSDITEATAELLEELVKYNCRPNSILTIDHINHCISKDFKNPEEELPEEVVIPPATFQRFALRILQGVNCTAKRDALFLLHLYCEAYLLKMLKAAEMITMACKKTNSTSNIPRITPIELTVAFHIYNM